MSAFYIISKLFTYLLLPPGIFVVLSLVAVFFVKKFKSFFIFFALSFYLLSNSFVSNALLNSLEKPYNTKLLRQNVDAVIVLGGGSVAGSANLPLSSDAYKRAMYALLLAKSQNVPLFFSGAGINNNYTEADALKDSFKEIEQFLAIKIPTDQEFQKNQFALYLEDKSLDTYENAQYSKEKFISSGILNPTIYLVTSAYHMPRALMLYEQFGFRAIPAATDFKVGTREKVIWDYLPNMDALTNSYRALHEYAGILSVYLRR